MDCPSQIELTLDMVENAIFSTSCADLSNIDFAMLLHENSKESAFHTQNLPLDTVRSIKLTKSTRHR